MLKFIKPGFFTTLQDSGRFGLRDKGVPVSGAMDSISSALANKILHNNEQDAVLEITMTGPEILFQKETYLTVTGALFEMRLNDLGIENNQIYKVIRGDVLSFGKLLEGFRAYLSVKGGFHSKKILHSQSLYTPITDTNHFKKDDVLPYAETKIFNFDITNIVVPQYILTETVLNVYKGPEYGLLTDRQLEHLFYKTFSVAMENDRMAYKIQETIDAHSISMLTSATLPGTVQLTPSGKLIILMKDGQTTGGYPRILQLSDSAISILAQRKASDKIRFRLRG